MPTPLEILLDPVSLYILGMYLLLILWEAVFPARKLPHIPYWLDAEATVARVVHGRRPGEHTRGLALTFVGLSGIDRYMIEQSLRYLPPAPPSFRAGRRENAGLLNHLVGAQTWAPRPRATRRASADAQNALSW